MCWLFRAKNTIKIRSKKSHVDHGGKWHIAAYWCSFTTKFKKQKSLLSSQHSQKYEKQNTKGVTMYIKRKEHVLSLGFSTIIYCTNLDKLLHNLRPSSLPHNTIIISMDKDQHKEDSRHSFHKINPFQVNY